MRACACLAAAFALASCSTLQNIHDPQFGLLGDPPDLLKSIKCELITFYAANAARKRALDDIRNSLRREGTKTISMKTVLEHRYFDLDTDAYGAFVLESKIVDTAGVPGTSTSLANILSSSTGHSRTLTVGPNIGVQGTYDMNYNFAIQQDNKISNVVGAITEAELPAFEGPIGTDDPTQCYRAVVIGKYDEMAQGKYPILERFRRITVNLGLPLAAWLQENTTAMGVSRNILADDNPPKDKSGKSQQPVPVPPEYQNEGVDGGQMSYLFTVQYTGGIDAKYSLISPTWNPLAADLSASMVQTGVLSLYVNGYMAQAALGAKSGVVGIVGRAPPSTQRVFVVNGYPVDSNGKPTKNYPPVIIGPEPGAGPGPKDLGKEQRSIPPATRGPNRGQFFGPATPFLLTPGP
jgi:hypothetical protein